ncbi:MAG TPA: hypothetical protein VFZ52_23135 [Chryseolinea sp.]
MENLRLAVIYWLSGMIMVFLAGCEDYSMTRNHQPVFGKTLGGSEGPGSYTDHPNGDRYPYPEIIEKVYIPPYRLFADMKCLAWRITWPEYAATADVNMIPTVFSANGAFNSFYYLNNVDVANTYKTKFSIYYDEKVACSNILWDELDHTFNAPLGAMETVRFAKVDKTLDVIQYWVEERPALFENNWPGSNDLELDYAEGDFFIYHLTEQDLFGGIRIASMEPRIIEVYLAVPNL